MKNGKQISLVISLTLQMSVVQGFALSIYFWGGMSSGRELELEQGPFEDPRLPGNNESLATLHFHYLGSAGRWNRPPPPPIGPHPIPSDARSHRVFPPLRHLNLRCSGFPCPEAMKILTKKTTRSHLLEPSAPPLLIFWWYRDWDWAWDPRLIRPQTSS